jgi:cytochrome c-type biogenesis protein CcmH
VSRRLVLSWVLIAAVGVGALFVGTRDEAAPRTSQERVYAIADTIKCPRCAGQTVAESDIAIAREIRSEIARDVDDGRTDDEIRAQIADSYGQEYLTDPRRSGVVGLVWLIPLVAGLAAIGGLAFALTRWRSKRDEPVEVSDDDRELVAAARRVAE